MEARKQGEHEITYVSASFLQKIVKMIKSIKNTIAINIGYPNPPFRTIAPIGAPINRKIKQITAILNFTFSS